MPAEETAAASLAETLARALAALARTDDARVASWAEGLAGGEAAAAEPAWLIPDVEES
jgi:hypothetical protein